MINVNLKEQLDNINKDTSLFFEDKDKQSLFYYRQMIDLMFSELVLEIQNKSVLSMVVNDCFKKNLLIIFDNMRKYALKTYETSSKTFNELIKVSVSNRYININNLESLYLNFKIEISKNLGIENKIKTLILANMNSFKGQLFSKFLIENNSKINQIIERYNNLLIEESIKNIISKKDFVLSSYREIIDNILNEIYEQKDVVQQKNLDLIVNSAYTYLKEKEYIIINKYIEEAKKNIDDLFFNLENILITDIGAKRNNVNLNPAKDYLHGFNNTIGVKVKNIFDQMNLVVTLEKEETNEKLKEFNELVTHIYEVNLVFDKQFLEYKKQFVLFSKSDKFDEAFSEGQKEITEMIKTNISNIFRDSIKIYNDVVYKTMLLKSKLYEYNTLLTYEQVKDSLF